MSDPALVQIAKELKRMNNMLEYWMECEGFEYAKK